ncbi:methionine--tRNA ligase [Humisphaera borealis]|uniref:Methionine--tRNA ligase n=1 Tax=Humisphaera borealis TaxID=2807512 RepID=A0A7M2WWZ4_9BACT|nr:methionine--tRNA ligase [Humisphaera borealis]QOV89996.1 methionine--tRNA ligase [Humisphaera borealis]
MAKTFYITTPIYYPNGEPHLGHVYTTLATDTIARYRRLAGDDVRFLTGTDEHGIKMVKTAEEKGITPEALATKNADVFRNLWKEFNVTNDDFIRTSEPRHKAGVQEIVRKLLASDDIYLGGYEGWYDEGQEEFITETEAKAAEYKSVISGRPLVRYKEPSYFFRLSKWAPKVLEYIEQNPTFIQPDSRRNEVISKLKIQLKEGFQDLSISRATLKWGVPMPNDPAHVVYVWIDALSNYITALGYGGGEASLFDKYWPADVHLIGKEILWFHTVYWPAMLFALGLPAPKQVFAHGWWTAEGKKMSKSLGNFIDIEKLREVNKSYGLDGLRFYTLRSAPFGTDLDWKAADLNTSFNELGNVVGNLLNRVVNMTTRYREAAIPAIGETDDAVDAAVRKATDAFPVDLANAYDALALQQAAMIPVELARAANVYIDTTAPFKLAKDPAKAARLDTVLNLSAQAIYRALVGLLPILPEKAKEGLSQLGVSEEGKTLAELFSTPLPAGHKLGEGKVLFPKVV